MTPKWNLNDTNMNPKWNQNADSFWRISVRILKDSGGILERFWEASGGSLGSLRGPWGVLRGPSGRSQGPVGDPWGVPGVPVGDPGEVPGAARGSLPAPRIPKSVQSV